MKIFYFSSTGNSLYVSKKIKEKIEDTEIVSINKALKENKFDFTNEKEIGFVFPLHSFGLPIVVREFIKKIRLKEDCYVFAIQVTGGGRSKASFEDINNLLANNNVKLTTIYEVKYVSNYIRAGRDATKDRAKEAFYKAEAEIEKIIPKIKDKENNSKNIRGEISHKLIHKMWMNLYKSKDKGFNVDDSCIGCSICERICPTNNIKLVDKTPMWNGQCVDCMACINNCPKNSINIGKKTQKKSRYRNSEIKLEELL
ncbi:EFR1 family ferrodoxin [Clostridium sp.]|uniref:EFR1 family ferrodoxin n=1 Tax=Clostridium sp. TaxID=1506 RepID=UPI003F2C0F9F